MLIFREVEWKAYEDFAYFWNILESEIISKLNMKRKEI